jgi:hypothetical protein
MSRRRTCSTSTEAADRRATSPNASRRNVSVSSRESSKTPHVRS